MPVAFAFLKYKIIGLGGCPQPSMGFVAAGKKVAESRGLAKIFTWTTLSLHRASRGDHRRDRERGLSHMRRVAAAAAGGCGATVGPGGRR